MGISHSWNGTVLTITSDSGTSSADLKGDTGIRGPQGAQGPKGEIDTSLVYTIKNPPSAEAVGAVPVSRTINQKALDSDIVLTAADIGARPNGWMPTAAEVGAREANWMPTAAEVGARPSDWMPTAAEVGASPTGYGYDGNVQPKLFNFSNDTDGSLLNSALDEQIATMNNRNVMQILFVDAPVLHTAEFFGTLYRHDASYCVLTGWSYSGEIVRKVKNGTWQPWERVNPPMNIGVEYRTTERHNGKAVYTKLVNLGALPGRNGNIHVATGVSATAIVRATAQISDGSTMPYGYSRELISFSVSTATINVYTADNEYAVYTDKTGTAQIWYTKD